MNNISRDVTVFDQFAEEYDRWFDSHVFVFQSEVEAIRRFVPTKGLGVEIGVGTGRFSVPFSITICVEPSPAMAAIAHSRGITVHLARAEQFSQRSVPHPEARWLAHSRNHRQRH